ncbi:MAG: FAD-binding oxidoreductase [Acidimicrobiia bacterium]|nr:FAD-binding oxidoreductase [Acidimicrobiia bacterium]
MQNVLDVTVVGSGVSGLTTAIRLAEAGFSTSILTRERATNTTSIVAAAIWFPEPGSRSFMERSLEVFLELIGDESAGVYPLDVTEYVDYPLDDANPSWAQPLRSYRILTADEVPATFAAGHVLGTVRIEPPIYLPYLENRFETLGGVITEQDVTDLSDVARENRVVVNCTGLGARSLVGDTSMQPVRGQVVHVENPGITDGHHTQIEGGPFTYVLPRNEVVVLGGTRLVGEWSLVPDDETTKRIVEDARSLDPRLATSEIVKVAVGLRPGRPTVRVELEETLSGLVAHNYGHDGNGYGLSWGCAEEVVRLIEYATSTS